jgi:putative acetyltransferase
VFLSDLYEITAGVVKNRCGDWSHGDRWLRKLNSFCTCEATRGIGEEYGTQQAFEYLVGDKFLNFIEAAGDHASFSEIGVKEAEMSVKIRHETESDRHVIWKVNQETFGGSAEADLVDALRNGGFAAVSLIAEADGEIVGHIMFSEVTIQTNKVPIEILSLAPMAVLPRFQRQGIGSALVAAGIEECRKLGYSSIVVLGHPEFYPRFGFSSDLASRLSCPFGRGEAWMALELVPGVLEDVTGTVQYPPPFDVFN